jgi:tRNA pseudouridine38-40 synthase
METESNIRLILEYDGAGFHGWQKQPGGLRTIQAELERVLQMVLRRPIRRLTAAGRTDAGVHARGQVVNFKVDTPPPELDLSRLAHAVSNILKGEVSVIKAELAPAGFDARHDAQAKQYRYWILTRPVPAVLDRGKVWHLGVRLDHSKMQQEAAVLVGLHDFTSFRGPDCNSKSAVREVLESEFLFDGDYLIYRIVGRGFLKQMVRNIVGTLVGIGKGSLEASMTEILAAKNRQAAGVTAPGYALFLDWVKY